MFIPLWALICGVILLAANFVVDLFRLRGRHHDHLLPNTPRSPRG